MSESQQNQLQLIGSGQKIIVILSQSSPILKFDQKNIMNLVVRSQLFSKMEQKDVLYDSTNHVYSKQSKGYISSVYLSRQVSQAGRVEELRENLSKKYTLILPEFQQELSELVKRSRQLYLSCKCVDTAFHQFYKDVESFIHQLQQAQRLWLPLIFNNEALCSHVLTHENTSNQVQTPQTQVAQAEHFICVLKELQDMRKDRKKIDHILSLRRGHILETIQYEQISDSGFAKEFTEYICTFKFLILSFEDRKNTILQDARRKRCKFQQAVNTFFNMGWQPTQADIYYLRDYMCQILVIFTQTFDQIQRHDRKGRGLLKFEAILKNLPNYPLVKNALMDLDALRKSLWPSLYEKLMQDLSQQNDLICCNSKNFFGEYKINPSNFRILKQLSHIYNKFESHHLILSPVKELYRRHAGHIRKVISDLKLESKGNNHFFQIPRLKILSKYLNRQMYKFQFLDKAQIREIIRTIDQRLDRAREKIRIHFSKFDSNEKAFILFQILDAQDHKLMPEFEPDDLTTLKLEYQNNPLDQSPFQEYLQQRRP